MASSFADETFQDVPVDGSDNLESTDLQPDRSSSPTHESSDNSFGQVPLSPSNVEDEPSSSSRNYSDVLDPSVTFTIPNLSSTSIATGDDEPVSYSIPQHPSYSTSLTSSSQPSALPSESEFGAVTPGKIWFDRIRTRHNKFSEQHNKDPDFFKHEKHVFILSYAGRPIFSRYGDETMLAAYMGVISAIISNIESMKDTVRTIIAGDWKFVFLFRGPIYMLCVTNTTESVHQLRAQLNMAHAQLLTFLTGSIHGVLERAPNYDLRNLMGGTTNSLLHLISQASVHPAYLWEAINVLRLRADVRHRVGAVLSACRQKAPGYGGKVSKGLKYAILLSRTHLVNLVRPKDNALFPSDLLLLINFVTSSSSIRNGEVWTPICLPKFNDKGFLYAYVCYLEGDVCLILITTDSEDFPSMSACKQFVHDALQNSGDLASIQEATENHYLSLADLEGEICVPELRHFIYKSESTSQLVIPLCAPPYTTYAQQKALHRRYQQMNAKMTASKRRHVIYFEVTDHDSMLGWIRSGEFEMYLVLTSLCHKQHAITAANRILKVIQREQNNLFILNAPSW